MEGPEKSELDEMLDGITAPVAKPTEPTEPVEPVAPVEPIPPVEPVKPVEPAEPVTPVEPTEPIPPVEPTKPVEPVEPVKPTEPVEPVEPAPPTEPVVPTEPTEPVAETPEQTVTRLEEQNRLLLERVEHLSTPQEFRSVEPPVQEPTEPVVPAIVPPVVAPTTAAPPGTAVEPAAVIPTPAVPAVQPTVAEQKVYDFIKDKNVEDITDNPAEFNSLLNEVVNQAGVRNVDVVVEKILTSIPNLVAGQIVQQNALNTMVNAFYESNPDLTSAKRTVSGYVNEVHAEHPDWEVKDVFNESATRTRKVLGLKEQALGRSEPPANPPANPPAETPAFARQRGARRGAEVELTGMAGEIDDMLKVS